MSEEEKKELIKCEICGQEMVSGLKMHQRSKACLEAKARRAPVGEGRGERVPLGVLHLQMTVDDIPENKVGRWVNDDGDRLNRAVKGGYDFIKDRKKVGDGYEDGNEDLGMMTSKVVGSKDSGEPIRAYLMIIDKDLYEQDQQVKLDRIDEVEEAIYSGKKHDLGDKAYVPEEGIKHSVKDHP